VIADAPWLLPLSGLFSGLVLGGVARHFRFCTLSALERHWYAADSRGLRTWVLAAAVAIVATQALVVANLVDVDRSFYLLPRLGLAGAIVGGVLFGIGMALVGTCGFGALVRLGGGSLRSLIVVAVIGLTAVSTQLGPLGVVRERFFEPLSVDLAPAMSQSIPSLVEAFSGLPIGWPAAFLCLTALLYWVFRDSAFRHDRTAIASGSVIGLCIAFGWLATSQLGRYLFDPVQIESASFVLPPGQLIQQLTYVNGGSADYGVGLLVGVVVGAAVVARIGDDVSWEACDDASELRRHLLGAVLMGMGGVLAAGCTIGQGVSAVSLLAVSAPIVLASMALGARIGLSWLLEGSPVSFLRAN